MKRNIYDLYDLAGNKVIEGMTGDEISKALNVTSAHVSNCAIGNMSLLRKYRVVKVGEEENSKENTIKTLLMTEWDKVAEPFRKVIWVKKYVPGVKRLTV